MVFLAEAYASNFIGQSVFALSYIYV